MNEFMRINWKIEDLSELEIQSEFIKEDVLSESLIFKSFEMPLHTLSKTLKKTKKSKCLTIEPNIPGEKFYFVPRNPSSLTKWQQEYCLEALILLQNGKPASTYTEKELMYINTYNECKPKILVENELYQKMALRLWNQYLHCYSPISFLNLQKSTKYWKSECERYLFYPSTYEEMSLISWYYHPDQDGTIEYKCVKNALEVGSLARFSQPSLITTMVLSTSTLPYLKNRQYNSQLVVSEDKNIEHILANETNVNIVLSGSSLKCLTDNTNLKIKWDMPVIVKKIPYKKEDGSGGSRTVVFVDKPLPYCNPTKMDLANYCMRQLIKMNFCEHEAFKYPQANIPLNDQIEFSEEGQSSTRKCATEHQNAQYRIWNIKRLADPNLMKNKTDNSEINILIRNQVTACEMSENGTLTSVIVKPKIEQQIKLGANIPSKKELCNEWTSLFFTPFSNLYRVRMHHNPAEVISIEKCTIQKVINEATVHHEFKPQFGLGIIEKVLREVKNLEEGEYLLHHEPKHEAFISLMKNCNNLKSGVYNLKDEHKNCCIENSPNVIPWLPIDVNYILPIYKYHNRMPAMFTPRGAKNDNLKKKKSQKKKKGLTA